MSNDTVNTTERLSASAARKMALESGGSDKGQLLLNQLLAEIEGEAKNGRTCLRDPKSFEWLSLWCQIEISVPLTGTSAVSVRFKRIVVRTTGEGKCKL
jgi:hypothetical protein